MDSLQIKTGEKRIAINGDPERVIVFNPSDLLFAEKFYGLIGEFETRLTEYQNRSEAMDAVTELDANELPVNMDERIALLRETCTFIRERIDYLFGAGTSQKAFGDALNFNAIIQFFNGIMPFVQSVRKEKVAKYTNTAAKVSSKRKK